jgi:hypothetical protein
MVNMGDDGDVSEVIYHDRFQLLSPDMTPWCNQRTERAQVTRFGHFKQCF